MKYIQAFELLLLRIGNDYLLLSCWCFSSFCRSVDRFWRVFWDEPNHG